MKKKTPEDAARAIDVALHDVHCYAGNVDDWIIVKKELLKNLPAGIRHVFSTRDPLTKKQRTNDFERELAKRWSVLTGRAVVFMSDDEQADTDLT